MGRKRWFVNEEFAQKGGAKTLKKMPTVVYMDSIGVLPKGGNTLVLMGMVLIQIVMVMMIVVREPFILIVMVMVLVIQTLRRFQKKQMVMLKTTRTVMIVMPLSILMQMTCWMMASTSS